MLVKFKRLNEQAILPKKATAGSIAYDLYICENTLVVPGRQIIGLGFAIEMPSNIEAKIEARSGFSSKGIEGYESLLSAPVRFDADVVTGKIDSDYRNEIGVIINNRSKCEFILEAKTKIAQMTFYRTESVEFTEVQELSKTDRQGGFGSTGAK